MEVYNNINSFKLDDNDYLFFDIFCRNNELILIIPTLPINVLQKLNIYCNSILIDKIKYDHSTRWSRVLCYEININSDEIVNITVQSNSKIQEYKLQHLMLNKSLTLTQTTLFKDDSFLLNKFINYYLKSGVDHFFLYYNGNNIINNIESKFLKSVTLIEWNYSYYYNNIRGYVYAQETQMNHSLYKYGKPLSQYIIYNDLDEYMLTKKKTIREYVLNYQNVDTFMFLNIWADTMDTIDNITEYYNHIQQDLNLPTEFYISKYINDPKIHSKCIHKTDSLYILNSIHFGEHYVNTKNIIFNNLYMFHFFRWVPSHIDHPVRTRENMGIREYLVYKNL